MRPWIGVDIQTPEKPQSSCTLLARVMQKTTQENRHEETFLAR